MSIITRPTKLGGGTDFLPGNDELAEEFNGDANTIYNDYNGNIKNANCAADMALDGTKLADAPSGVPTAKINDLSITTAKIVDKAVSAAKLANDPLVDGNRAVSTDHIRVLAVTTSRLNDAAVTALKLAADAIIASKVKRLTHDWTPGGSLAPESFVNHNTGLDNTVLPISVYTEGTTAVITGTRAGLISVNYWWNTTTATWYMTVGNADTTNSINIASMTFKLNYIQAS